jgi:hypothetical protein
MNNHSRKYDRADLILKPPIILKYQSFPRRHKAPGTGYRVRHEWAYNTEKHVAAIGGKNLAMQIISSGGSLARIEELRALGLPLTLRRNQILGGDDDKGFQELI